MKKQDLIDYVTDHGLVVEGDETCDELREAIQFLKGTHK
jgi:hypothetical protein